MNMVLMCATNGCGLWDMTGGRLDLHNADTDRQKEQGQPFCGAQFSPQECHGEGRRGENLHLVCHLEGSDGEIADGNELERVLNHIENGGD